jgi:hypothetical protein
MSLKKVVIKDERVGRGREKITRITKTKGRLNTDDIIAIYNNINDRYGGGNKKIMIKAMGRDKRMTFKGYYTDFNMLTAEEYYEGRVVNPEVFDQFFFCEVYIADDIY